MSSEDFTEARTMQQGSLVIGVSGLDHVVFAKVRRLGWLYARFKDRIIHNAVRAGIRPGHQTVDIHPRRRGKHRMMLPTDDPLCLQTQEIWGEIWCDHVKA